MCRNVSEVTHMAAKLKENCYRVPGHENTTDEIPGLEITKKVKILLKLLAILIDNT